MQRITKIYDILRHGRVMAWDHERGLLYADESDQRTRWDILRPVLKIAIAGGWIAGMILAIVIVLTR